MPKFRKKSYKKHKKPLNKKQFKKNTPKNAEPNKKTNFKFIQRGKEMVTQHRRQKEIEEKYRKEATNFLLEQELATAKKLLPEEEEEANPLEQLVAQFQAEESNGSSDDSDENEELNDEENHDVEGSEGEFEEDEMDDEQLSGEEELDDEMLEQDDDLEDDELEEEDGESEDEDLLAEGEEDLEDDDISENEEDSVSNDSEEGSDDNLKEENSLKNAEVNENKSINVTLDAFSKHLDFDLQPEQVENLLASSARKLILHLKWPSLKKLILEKPLLKEEKEDIAATSKKESSIESYTNEVYSSEDLIRLGVKKSLVDHSHKTLSSLESELLTILNHYHDFYYPERTFDNAEEIRFVYCLHLLNHMLKTRARILNNSSKLAATAKSKKINKNDLIVSDSLRDQGLVRPKILLIVPLRDSAFKVVNTMIDLLFGKERDKTKSKNQIMNYERFESEYTGNNLYFPKTNPKPEDYEKTFSGNTDDNFRIGITLTKKSMKLYTEFYSSDIIIASPLALRLVIAGDSESNEKDYDFLNSIEMLIIDQGELLFAQNWENLLHVLEHLHLQPQSLRDTNFQRVREWYLSGLAKYYRQTLFFCSHELPEFRSLFNNKCSNYEGKVRLQNPILQGHIRNIMIPLSQTFQRINVSSLATMFDQRFEYFTQKVLPRFKNPSYAHCMIYIPSYFDFVRIRNYFRKETINFVQICEYSEKGKIAKARDLFFHSGAHFMLYSERSHFFKRTRIKGIRHLIMYQPPSWPNFYSEMINLMHESNQNSKDDLENSMSITVLYTKYDLLQLSNIIGTENAGKIINSSKSVHVFASQCDS